MPDRARQAAQDLLGLLAVEQPELVPLCAQILVKLHAPCRHGPDFACVVWHGQHFSFTPTQGAIVKSLWDAWLNGTPDVRHETLLLAADSEAQSIGDLFQKHPAWRTMIVPSPSKGAFRLTAPD